MGNIIVSWSPVHGQSATTSNVVALASAMSLRESYRSLLTHTQLSYSTMEAMYAKNNTSFNDSGLLALERLVKSNLLKADAIRDYTETVYKDRLDFLSGKKDGLEGGEEKEQLLQAILKTAKEKYDFLWIDAHSGVRSQMSKEILEQADLVLVNLPQNKFILERFFNGTDFPKQLEGKPYIILISKYDDKSGFSLRNIKRQFKVKEPLYAIPYATAFQDAANQESIVEFFYRILNVPKKHDLYPFSQSLDKINQVILKQLDFKRAEDDWE